MDSNLQMKLEEKYEEVYPIDEIIVFQRINPKNKNKMNVKYQIMGFDFVIKVEKPQEYISLLILMNKNRKDSRVEGLILENKGFRITQEELRGADFASNLAHKIDKLHQEGDLWIEGEKPHPKRDPNSGFWSMFKKILNKETS